MRRTLYLLHYGDEWIRGSERVLLDMLEHIDRSRWKPVLICNSESMAVEARRLDVDTFVEPMPVPRAGLPRFGEVKLLLRLALSLWKHLRGSRLTGSTPVVHVNSAAPCQWAAPVARILRIPFLVQLHADYLPGARFAFFVHFADRIVGVSNDTLNGVRADGFDQDRLRVIYNGVNPSRFSVASRPRDKSPAGSLRVVSVGSLIRRKGHDRLIQAIAEAAKTIDIRLTIIGGGPMFAELEAIAAREGVTDKVVLLGDVPVSSSIFEAADVLALASRHETFGLVLAEAGLHGLPVVATPVGGVSEVVVDGETGWLIPGNDQDVIAGFALRFCALAGNPALTQAIGRAARHRIHATFPVHGMVRRFEDLWDELATAPHRFRFPLKPYRTMLKRYLLPQSGGRHRV